MSFAKCFDVVTMVIDEASEQFDEASEQFGFPLYEDEDKKEELEEYCDMIDAFARRFGGVSYEAEVDDKTTDIIVSVVCGEFEIYDCADDFYKLVEAAKGVSFRAVDGDTVRVSLRFNGIWGAL